MPGLKTLAEPSDLFDAIRETLLERLRGVQVDDYAGFEHDTVVDALVLIEFEQSAPATRGNDGRYCHEFTLMVHGVVGRQRKRAGLAAINLASAIERIVDLNCWGIDPDQIDVPEAIHSEPSLFKSGAHGFEAWGCNFRQRVYLGDSGYPEDPVLGGMPFVDVNASGDFERWDDPGAL